MAIQMESPHKVANALQGWPFRRVAIQMENASVLSARWEQGTIPKEMQNVGTVTRAKCEAPYANFRGVIFRARSTKIHNRDPPYASGPPYANFRAER